MKNCLESDWTRRVQDGPHCPLQFEYCIPAQDSFLENVLNIKISKKRLLCK